MSIISCLLSSSSRIFTITLISWISVPTPMMRKLKTIFLNLGVIRLKYKADHDLAGIKNGNRLVNMVLEARCIPYSIRIGSEWYRVIHNNQQPVCSEW